MLRIQEKNESGEVVTGEKSVTQNSNKNSCAVAVKAKQKDRKYALLKRLMLFGLRPSLRMAALKMLMCKKKKLALCDLSSDDVDGKNSYIFEDVYLLTSMDRFGNTVALFVIRCTDT